MYKPNIKKRRSYKDEINEFEVNLNKSEKSNLEFCKPDEVQLDKNNEKKLKNNLDSAKLIVNTDSSIQKNNQTSLIIIILLFFVIAINFIILFLLPSQKLVNTDIVNRIRSKIPKQNQNIFQDFTTVLDDFSYRDNSVAVFLFLYKKNKETEVQELLKNLADYAALKLDTTGFIEIPSSDFNSYESLLDYGTLIEKYRDEFAKRRVLITYNIQNMWGETAQVFHSICDEISPLVPNSVILLSLLDAEKDDTWIETEEDHSRNSGELKTVSLVNVLAETNIQNMEDEDARIVWIEKMKILKEKIAEWEKNLTDVKEILSDITDEWNLFEIEIETLKDKITRLALKDNWTDVKKNLRKVENKINKNFDKPIYTKSNKEKKAIEILKQKWKDLEEDVLISLITRVTALVFEIV